MVSKNQKGMVVSVASNMNAICPPRHGGAARSRLKNSTTIFYRHRSRPAARHQRTVIFPHGSWLLPSPRRRELRRTPHGSACVSVSVSDAELGIAMLNTGRATYGFHNYCLPVGHDLVHGDRQAHHILGRLSPDPCNYFVRPSVY